MSRVMCDVKEAAERMTEGQCQLSSGGDGPHESPHALILHGSTFSLVILINNAVLLFSIATIKKVAIVFLFQLSTFY